MRYDVPSVLGVARLEVFDAGGRFVRELYDVRVSELAIGNTTWDLTDARGIAVAQGMYFIRLRAGVEEVTSRVIIVR